jgi:hypothetical protein
MSNLGMPLSAALRKLRDMFAPYAGDGVEIQPVALCEMLRAFDMAAEEAAVLEMIAAGGLNRVKSDAERFMADNVIAFPKRGGAA